MLTGNGRHRRPRQAPALLVAAGVTGSAIAIPLLGAASASAADGTTWDKVAECESGGSWSADTGNGYYGGLQISQDDWDKYGGTQYAQSADQASRSQQIAVAEKILADQGTKPWTMCALTAGLTSSSGSVDVDTGVGGSGSSARSGGGSGSADGSNSSGLSDSSSTGAGSGSGSGSQSGSKSGSGADSSPGSSASTAPGRGGGAGKAQGAGGGSTESGSPKTDKTDTRHLRVHLMAGDLPECWIPPEHVLEARATARLYKDLVDERGGWHQRVAATLFHHGVPAAVSVARPDGRAAAEQAFLSPAGRQAVQTGLRQIDRLTAELEPLRRQLDMLSRRQPGCGGGCADTPRPRLPPSLWTSAR